MKELHKITVGYVLQKWDFQTKEYLGAEFIAGDDVSYENELGEFVEEQEPSYEPIDFGKANNE